MHRSSKENLAVKFLTVKPASLLPRNFKCQLKTILDTLSGLEWLTGSLDCVGNDTVGTEKFHRRSAVRKA